MRYPSRVGAAPCTQEPVSIDERPAIVAKKLRIRDFKGDTVIG